MVPDSTPVFFLWPRDKIKTDAGRAARLKVSTKPDEELGLDWIPAGVDLHDIIASISSDLVNLQVVLIYGPVTN